MCEKHVSVAGDLYTFGESANGRLGLQVEQLDNHRVPQRVQGVLGHVTQVCCGGQHTVVLTGTVTAQLSFHPNLIEFSLFAKFQFKSRLLEGTTVTAKMPNQPIENNPSHTRSLMGAACSPSIP